MVFGELSLLMVAPMYRNKGQSGYEIFFGHTPDISEYVEFEFYDYFWYWDTPQNYPHEKKQLGRWIGVAHRVGQSMVFWIMNTNGKFVGQSTVSPLDPSYYDVNECKKRMSALDTTIKSSIGDYRNAVNVKNTEVPNFDDEDIKEHAIARKEVIDLTTIEPLRPDENYGEILVKNAKLASSKLMVRING